MRSALPLLRTPATPWAMMHSPRRTAAAMPKRSLPLPSIDCRMPSTLTGALSSDEPGGFKSSDLEASIMVLDPKPQSNQAPVSIIDGRGNHSRCHQNPIPINLAFHRRIPAAIRDKEAHRSSQRKSHAGKHDTDGEEIG